MVLFLVSVLTSTMVLFLVSVLTSTLVLLDQVDGAPVVQAVPPMVGRDMVEFDDSGKRADLLPGAQVEPCSGPDDAVKADPDDAGGVNVTVLVSTWEPPVVQWALKVASAEAVDRDKPLLDQEDVMDGVLPELSPVEGSIVRVNVSTTVSRESPDVCESPTVPKKLDTTVRVIHDPEVVLP
ncbi:hypothetical protein OCS_03506 [Ophiocordyceps sinensis CO18]|nr:hypothetical protein OCS_03506 [Ophiocordyceps sinensis CO18]